MKDRFDGNGSRVLEEALGEDDLNGFLTWFDAEMDVLMDVKIYEAPDSNEQIEGLESDIEVFRGLVGNVIACTKAHSENPKLWRSMARMAKQNPGARDLKRQAVIVFNALNAANPADRLSLTEGERQVILNATKVRLESLPRPTDVDEEALKAITEAHGLNTAYHLLAQLYVESRRSDLAILARRRADMIEHNNFATKSPLVRLLLNHNLGETATRVMRGYDGERASVLHNLTMPPDLLIEGATEAEEALGWPKLTADSSGIQKVLTEAHQRSQLEYSDENQGLKPFDDACLRLIDELEKAKLFSLNDGFTRSFYIDENPLDRLNELLFRNGTLTPDQDPDQDDVKSEEYKEMVDIVKHANLIQ